MTMIRERCRSSGLCRNEAVVTAYGDEGQPFPCCAACLEAYAPPTEPPAFAVADDEDARAELLRLGIAEEISMSRHDRSDR